MNAHGSKLFQLAPGNQNCDSSHQDIGDGQTDPDRVNAKSCLGVE